MTQGMPNDDLLEKIAGMFDQVCAGMEALSARMGGLEQRMGGLENRMGDLEHRMGGLEHRMDRVEAAQMETTRALVALQETVKVHYLLISELRNAG